MAVEKSVSNGWKSEEIAFFCAMAFLGGIVVGTLAFVVLLSLGDLFDFEKWQTLVVGIVGAVIAFGTIAAIFFQIRQISILDENKRRRENLAGRAHLSQSLSNICDYERQCAESLMALVPTVAGLMRVQNQNYQPPAFPIAELPILVRGVETSDFPEADQIFYLLANLQIQSARLNQLALDLRSPTASVTRWNIDDYIINAADAYTRASRLLLYSRREHEEDAANPTYSQIQDSLRILDVDESLFPDVWRFSASRYRAET